MPTVVLILLAHASLGLFPLGRRRRRPPAASSLRFPPSCHGVRPCPPCASTASPPAGRTGPPSGSFPGTTWRRSAEGSSPGSTTARPARRALDGPQLAPACRRLVSAYFRCGRAGRAGAPRFLRCAPPWLIDVPTWLSVRMPNPGSGAARGHRGDHPAHRRRRHRPPYEPGARAPTLSSLLECSHAKHSR